MKAVFASDFDNTMTSIDFYRVIMDKYPMGSEAEELYQAWQAQKLKDLDFLGYIFEHYGQDEATLRKDILSTPVDPKAVDFVNWFTDNGGMFYIISAGCRYYIDIILEEYGIADRIRVVSNPGKFIDNSLIVTPNINDQFYSPVFGVDKDKAMKQIKSQSKISFYAGDSLPDIGAAMSADYAYAKTGHRLLTMLKENNHPNYFEFGDFGFIRESVQSILRTKNFL